MKNTAATTTKTEWTRAEVEARFVRATGEAVPANTKSIDLWVWANEAIQAKRAALR